ncbi:DUF6457 domain-containing protein [Naumannella halotolerans]|uniref:DUF6457 domain-containing protein n=1 Tax=Naumannella halotolerans TaxID=993414 RepID=A0A4V3ENB4_9ACTN|nr:DUF6457 domain-containing protein [Naumannella halotolerans]TDT32878.1 hypothetical protein CLV29_0468 [Naumannella halotolerans]
MATQTNTLNGWLREVCAVLDIPEEDLDEDARHILLDLSRDAAHQVIRPAAPLTAYLIGVAVGRGASLSAASAKVQLALPTEAGQDAEIEFEES